MAIFNDADVQLIAVLGDLSENDPPKPESGLRWVEPNHRTVLLVRGNHDWETTGAF